MKNINSFRIALDAMGMTVNQASKLSGLGYDTIWKHYKGFRAISAEMAKQYHVAFGIPLWKLRPDLWEAPKEKEEAAV